MTDKRKTVQNSGLYIKIFIQIVRLMKHKMSYKYNEYSYQIC